MNAHDSEKLAGILAGMGYSPAEDFKKAGVIVYNTCCIRENAENRVIGNLGFLKHVRKENPELLVAVGGCMPQQEKSFERLKKTGVVDIIFGTHNLHTFGELLTKALAAKEPVASIWEAHDGSTPDEACAVRESPWRSGVNIMYGCDNFCSYCVVPYVRGRERSRAAADVLAEVKSLVRDGVLEIILLGQNVNSYLDKENGTTFPELLGTISRTEDAPPRIRFMTSHPKDLSPELISVIRENGNICRHLHLPVQSGSNAVLSAMNRKYTREDYLNLLKNIRREISDISITTDIIAGFPGETEEDFRQTLELVREARFNGAFTFLYSKRENTSASGMGGQVPESVAKDRLNRLIGEVNPIALEIAKTYEGRTVHVLAERHEGGVCTGRAENNTPVHFLYTDGLLGTIVPVRITEARTFYMRGECIEA